jgi:hypothetical protein
MHLLMETFFVIPAHLDNSSSPSAEERDALDRACVDQDRTSHLVGVSGHEGCHLRQLTRFRMLYSQEV